MWTDITLWHNKLQLISSTTIIFRKFKSPHCRGRRGRWRGWWEGQWGGRWRRHVLPQRWRFRCHRDRRGVHVGVSVHGGGRDFFRRSHWWPGETNTLASGSPRPVGGIYVHLHLFVHSLFWGQFMVDGSLYMPAVGKNPDYRNLHFFLYICLKINCRGTFLYFSY